VVNATSLTSAMREKNSKKIGLNMVFTTRMYDI
jgi:hypothetical protein